MDDELARLRSTYGRAELSRSVVATDPIVQFEKWFREAQDAGVPDPNAMTLATASATRRPSARVVLLKDVGPKGFTFFTNYNSRKARDLDDNPAASAVFWWRELERQVRIDGQATRITAAESDEYFRTRPKGSQIGAWASPQSEVILSRDELERRVQELNNKYGDQVPRPQFWGGYRLVPDTIEFWQGRPSRLHDRIRYTETGGSWRIDRLAP